LTIAKQSSYIIPIVILERMTIGIIYDGMTGKWKSGGWRMAWGGEANVEMARDKGRVSPL